tara:strand:- start:170 stop:418 length:249 start_codon:yes stop_codon:yes gene_type:complete
MNSEFDTYIRKLRYYKELYLIDEEAYGDNDVSDLKLVLDDFIKYVELASSVTKPTITPSSLGQMGNWCDPFADSSKIKISEK